MTAPRHRVLLHAAPILLLGILGCAELGTRPSTPSIPLGPPPKTVNLARVRGTRLIVPSATADYPPQTLVDGITEVDSWKPGAGWQLTFDGPLLRNRYFSADTDMNVDEPIEWEGLRRDYRQGKEYSALGWILFEFQEPHVIRAVSLHSVDTEEYPADRFGVQDVFIQYWDEPTGRWLPTVPREGPRSKSNTVFNNKQAHLRVEFHPIRTGLLRIAIRWTNDTKRVRSFTVMGRREEYVKGTIRLVEVEVFGEPLEGDELTTQTTQRLPERSERAGMPSAEDVGPEAALQVVWAYADAYAGHDLDRLMETIAPTYDADGEDAEALRERMEQTFREFPDYLFRLSEPVVERFDGGTAIISTHFWLQLNPLLPRAAEGRMTFTLIRMGDRWRIQRIEASTDR